MGSGRLGLGPRGGRVHFTGDAEVRMESKGYGGRVRDVGPLRHKHLLPNGFVFGVSVVSG
ncbi:hypothetical protein Pyn_37384 [Prunus yedoensis var. nudiflora]|uniref:Uncharacterized protein n=1 Tax=Prunus yedoensis var. nudiflora TaxID=2094558 RepID=A0A314YPV2_PRUYE|nr:hypothetical protein Pyn_37384 [Prunus yedoensis var. nudiflora]